MQRLGRHRLHDADGGPDGDAHADRLPDPKIIAVGRADADADAEVVALADADAHAHAGTDRVTDAEGIADPDPDPDPEADRDADALTVARRRLHDPNDDERADATDGEPWADRCDEAGPHEDADGAVILDYGVQSWVRLCCDEQRPLGRPARHRRRSRRRIVVHAESQQRQRGARPYRTHHDGGPDHDVSNDANHVSARHRGSGEYSRRHHGWKRRRLVVHG
ncbi:MAG TPA: hypothetical protein VHT05_01795, partial [Candidatus Elarobacter sp.]|nr:hypothetical protein [Candidatus Elarobacter sp.]